MATNILILRTANYSVMDKLISYILSNYDNCKIYMIIQDNAFDNFYNKYNYINYITMNGKTFNYSNIKNKKSLVEQIRKLKFENVFMPSSVDNFFGFYNAFKFLKCLGIKEVELFNVNCNVLKRKVSIPLYMRFNARFFGILNKVVEVKIKIKYFLYINKDIWH